MTKKEALETLIEINKKMMVLNNIGATIGWDFETCMAKKGGEDKGDQMAYISGQMHELSCDPRLDEIFDTINAKTEGLSDRDRAIVRIMEKSYRDAKKVPTELVMAMAKATSESQNQWFSARQSGDFESFAPYLEKVVQLNKESGTCLAEGKMSVYDALLDQYESNMPSSKIDALFNDMEKTIHTVMEITKDKVVDDSFLFAKYPEKMQKRFNLSLLKNMGFDTDRGVIGISAHPFTTRIGDDDIRITARFTDPKVTDPLFSYMHEGGHALYEMGASTALTRKTTLASGVNMSMHESQSRTWENIIGHSAAFWKYYFPKFKAAYKKQTEGVEFDQFIRAINKVEASDVRVNADEVTYGLHIILRFRLEKALFDGDLKVKDLPEAWDKMSLSLLGRKPENLQSGVLQDTHWPSGMFGYFPSYALGNLINSQIYYTMKKDLDVEGLLENGKMKKIKAYLNDKIYKHGCIYEGSDLIKRITGEELSAKYFDQYLVSKYTSLFG